ncbi:DNA primase family protein [Sinorhizobium chiapasense]|uniref:Phage/plasmid primase, P4 family n=1 Tax=Sinorhizobium chiapasense TaxID=501572 RepID=A0ABZ2BCJ9_9HYPH
MTRGAEEPDIERFIARVVEKLDTQGKRKKEPREATEHAPDFFEIDESDRVLMLVDQLPPIDPGKESTSPFDFASRIRAALKGSAVYDSEHERWYLWSGEIWIRDDARNLRFAKVLDIALWRLTEKFVGSKRVAACSPEFRGKVEKALRPVCKAYPPYRGPQRPDIRPRQEDLAGVDVWDGNPVLVGIPGGVVNLYRLGRDGYESDLPIRSEMMTKQLPVGSSKRPVLIPERRHFSSDPEVNCAELDAADATNEPPRLVYPPDFCPLFRGLLATATGGDESVIRSLQMFCGYALSGLTTEHAFLFLIGPGGNGKTLLLNILYRILGPYAIGADISTFTTGSHGNGYSADRARLRGARLVTVSESGKENQFDQGFLKALVGGDPIVARSLFTNPAGFRPQAKVIFAGNTIPSIATTDRGMRRRMLVLPFRGMPGAIDTQLESKILGDCIDKGILGNEAADIVRWLFDGWEMFRDNGFRLHVAEGIEDETGRYFDTQNPLHAWITERCEFGDNFREAEADLYASYESFVYERNKALPEVFLSEPPLKRGDFFDRLYATYPQVLRLGRKSYRRPGAKNPSAQAMASGIQVRRRRDSDES